MSNITVITGAAGFIGRNVVAELNRRGRTNLLLVDSLGQDDKWKNLQGLSFEDLVSPQDFLGSLSNLSGVTGIVHLGATSATTETDADLLLQNNYRYTRSLCEWALARDIRFVYASSAATYGDGKLGYDDAPDLLPRLRPLNMYGYSKHLFDLWAQKHGLFSRIVGLKYFNVFGPYEDHKGGMRSVAQRAYHQIKETGEVSLFKSYRPGIEDGEQKRDFIYVKDAVDVTLHFLENRQASGLLNCGTGLAKTWLALANAVFEAMKLPPKIRYIDMPEALREKYQYFTQADVTRLRAAGYRKDFASLERSVADYVHDYLEG